MAFQLEQQESPPQGVGRIAHEIVDEARQQLWEQPEGVAKAVHNTRKICKRMRALLRLVRDDLGQGVYRPENSDYRDISRILSPLRDSVVIVATFDAVCEQFAAELPESVGAALRPGLVARQEAIARELLDEQDVVTAVSDRLTTAKQRIDDWPLSKAGFAPLLPGFKRVYWRGQGRMTSAHAHQSPELYHDWRKRVKYLWHQVELLQPAWPVLLGQLADDLHQLSDFLGDAHDLVALDEVLVNEPEWVGDETAVATLLPFTKRRRRELEEAARPWGLRLYAERPSAFVARMAGYWQAWQETTMPPVVEPEPPQLLSTQETADRLQVSVREVRQLIQTGQLPATKVSGVWVVLAASLRMFSDDFMENRNQPEMQEHEDIFE